MDYLWIIYGSGWWLVSTHLKTMKVNWDDDIPNIWENRKCSKAPTSHCCLNTAVADRCCALNFAPHLLGPKGVEIMPPSVPITANPSHFETLPVTLPATFALLKNVFT